ncbi:MAG TPA: Xaa-Pro peptidase family protein [Solirubrobacteraceae bacterium]|jgi:Xaa-Pro aminopeptidase|nr:Xaa-Pro peptidase family protein [Solirubrobacteraceae bacterium]
MTSTAEATSTRLQLLGEELLAREIDMLLVQAGADLRYVTLFTGSSGAALVRAGEGDGPRHLFLTDFRYQSQAAEQVPGAFAREIVAGELVDAIAEALAQSSGRLGFDDASTTVAAARRLGERLPEGWELVPCAGLVAGLRKVKDAREVGRIRAAAQVADEALREILEDGLAGRAERDVAIDLELRMRRLGAEAPSFPSIVACGEHGALPHAEPRDVEIPRDVLVTIDWGAVLDGYCSDCTRTYATGEGISARAREVYGLVLDAQRAGVAAVRPGPNGREVDAVARAIIDRAGEGERFGHGLGHGVGLEIHEGPRLSRTAGEEPLVAGNVVTVEPGVYIPGELGVRIEDLLAVTDEGAEELTGLPRELTVVA